MNICYDTDNSYDFSYLSLGNPKSLQGGAYFSKVKLDGDNSLIFQTPKCKAKSGIISTEKKKYCDLMFTSDNESFLEWLEHLETRIQQLIHNKQDAWFHNQMELSDIEEFYHSSMRIYQGDKYLVRVSINQPRYIRRATPLQIFDETENDLKEEDIKDSCNLICIIDVLGIKFTTTSIRAELCLRQIMVLNDTPTFTKCLIKNKFIEEDMKNTIKSDTKQCITTDINKETSQEIELIDKKINAAPKSEVVGDQEKATPKPEEVDELDTPKPEGKGELGTLKSETINDQETAASKSAGRPINWRFIRLRKIHIKN